MTTTAPIVTDNRVINVVPVLAVCRPDWHLAKKWLQLASHLQRLEILVLITSSDLTVAQVYELKQLAYRVASEVRVHHPNGFAEVGYFGGANQMFISAITFCEEFFGDDAMLWMEADTCPFREFWFDEVAAEFRLCERPFLGDVVLAAEIPHMTGNAVYHPRWRKLAPSMALLPGPVLEQGWDSQCAHETFPNCARSKTIQQRWRPPAITEAWLKENVPAECALFHQCKDGTAIDVMTDRLELPRIPLERALAVSTYPVGSPEPRVGFLPRVEILIVTCARDVEFLRYCLRGIREHASGFIAVKVVVPRHESAVFDWIRPRDGQVILFDEPAGKGMMAHELEKCRADVHCPDADYILHLDADCIPFRRFTPADYVSTVDGSALMVRENYTRITNPNRHLWRAVVQNAVGLLPKWDCMVRHPQVHPREVYKMTRNAVEQHTRIDFADYVLSCQNEFPQGFAEFPTIAAVGLQYCQDKYAPVEYDKDRDAALIGQHPSSFQYVYRRDRNHIVEFWSHGGIQRYRSDIEAIFAGRLPEYWVK